MVRYAGVVTPISDVLSAYLMPIHSTQATLALTVSPPLTTVLRVHQHRTSVQSVSTGSFSFQEGSVIV